MVFKLIQNLAFLNVNFFIRHFLPTVIFSWDWTDYDIIYNYSAKQKILSIPGNEFS